MMTATWTQIPPTMKQKYKKSLNKTYKAYLAIFIVKCAFYF